MEPTIPQGEPLRTFRSYRDAQHAVDYLAGRDFAVQNVTIVGHDLKMVERVTGKLSYSRAAGAGAASGAWFGLFVGLLMSFFSSNNGLELALVGALFGAGFGMFFGITSYAMTKRQRDFTSASQVVASAYSVYVAPEHLDRAQQILAGFRDGPDIGLPHAAQTPRPADRPATGPAPSANPFAYRGPQAPVAPRPAEPARTEDEDQPASAAPAAPAAPPKTYSERIEEERARAKAEAAARRRAEREPEERSADQ